MKSRQAKKGQHSSDKTLTYITALLVVIVTAATLGRIAGHEFLRWDDNTNFTENPDFNPVILPSIGHYWAHAKADLYAPITYTVWGVLALFAEEPTDTGSQLNPHVFHTASLLAHIGAALGVLLVLRRLGLRPWPATFGALIFAVHPLQTETVAWASGLKDLLAGGLSIWAIWFYLRAARDEANSSWWWRNYLLATLLFVLAMLSKPQAVSLPLVVVGLDFLLLRRGWRPVLTAIGPWFLLTIPIILIGRASQPALPEGLATPLIDRPLVALDDLAFYASKVVAPIHLTVDYAHSTARQLRRGPHMILWLVPPALAILALMTRRRAIWLATGLVIFVTAVSPILGFLPFDFQMYSNVADHYVYLAMLGPALIGAFAVQAMLKNYRRRGQVIAASILVVGGMAVATCVQAGYWQNYHTLFSRNLELQPDSFVANVQIGTYYSKLGRIDDAIALYRHGLLIKPDDAETRFDVANALSRQGNYADAINEYRRALQVWPTHPELHENLGIALSNAHRLDEAQSELEEANRLRPGVPGTLLYLAALAMQHDDVAKAKAYLSEALAADPNYAPAREMLQQIAQTERSRQQK